MERYAKQAAFWWINGVPIYDPINQKSEELAQAYLTEQGRLHIMKVIKEKFSPNVEKEIWKRVKELCAKEGVIMG